uniref:U3 small nucleolar RNA-associated protein 25 homolog n=1 Tax=Soboliphyme baturini TaxID=241478 RepID=A0A183IMU4_9BILA
LQGCSCYKEVKFICQQILIFTAHLRNIQTNELHFIIALHALNHALKTRGRILYHNEKLKEGSESQGILLEYRDHGLCRPKVLILCPFRSSAFAIVQQMIKVLFGKDSRKLVLNRRRFMREFGDPSTAKEAPVTTDSATKHNPDAERKVFSGNIDDCFHIGLGIAKKTLKLYVDFYSSDIIIASPIGLRVLMGNSTDKHFSADFLSSIEVLVFDQADVFLMQNWSHVIHMLENLHRQPKESHDVDFSRVRMWSLNDCVFSKFCSNFAGLVVVPQRTVLGTVVEVVNHFPQTFLRFACANRFVESEARLQFFVDNVLSKISSAGLRHVLIFLPSYFDFIRVRNHLKREDCSFVQICEYTSETKVSRARSLFFHGKKPILLLTERFHFFNRCLIRGIQHIIFYQLPLYSGFYSEFCNMVNDDPQSESKDHLCIVLYSVYDAFRISRVVGAEKSGSLLNSDKTSHIMITTD